MIIYVINFYILTRADVYRIFVFEAFSWQPQIYLTQRFQEKLPAYTFFLLVEVNWLIAE